MPSKYSSKWRLRQMSMYNASNLNPSSVQPATTKAVYNAPPAPSYGFNELNQPSTRIMGKVVKAPHNNASNSK